MDGTLGAMNLGNTVLVDYGIQTEQSDIRAHVCPVVRRVYIYPTAEGVAAVGTGVYPKRPGYQPGIDSPTAEGYLVPPFAIRKCSAIHINGGVWDYLAFDKKDSLSLLGQKAVSLVRQMILNGMFPLPAHAEEITEQDLQISGTDLIVRGKAIERPEIRIQVKCDFRGGDKALGGTGNLFLQVAECNPFKTV